MTYLNAMKSLATNEDGATAAISLKPWKISTTSSASANR